MYFEPAWDQLRVDKNKNDLNHTAENANERLPLTILFEDEQLVAVAKPSGMFVHRSLVDRSATEFVVQTLRDQLGCYVYPLHRLDRATSGVLLLTKSAEAASVFGAMFANRTVHKTYLALVRGYTDDADTINRPLVSDKGQGKSTANPHSIPQSAETVYRTLERFELPIPQGQHLTTRCSLVEARPKTGRFHQIRRHMAGIAHPVIGDACHGDTKFNRHIQQHSGASRLMLAATRLEFVHPTTGCNVVIECPPDASFSQVLDGMRRMKTNPASTP